MIGRDYYEAERCPMTSWDIWVHQAWDVLQLVSAGAGCLCLFVLVFGMIWSLFFAPELRK